MPKKKKPKKKKKQIKKNKPLKKKARKPPSKRTSLARDGKARKLKLRKLERKKSEETIHRTRIRVIGIGGGGSSIVSEIAPQLKRVDFVAANTDRQALRGVSKLVRTFQFGQNLTRGLGCGMDPRIGQKAVKDERQKIAKLFKGIDLCVLVATFGGGTSSGATPEFAKIAREMGVMTFGIFTLPFKFEGAKKSQVARSSLERITPYLNALSIIPNENIFKIIDKSTPLTQAFSAINRRLAENLRGLIEMIYLPGLINIDFADLKTVLDGRGKLSYLNSITSQGQNRAEEVVKEVLRSPLNEYNILGAEKILYNITAAQDLGMSEVENISRTISDFNRRAKIIFGVSQDSGYRDRIRITLLAVGCGKEVKPKAKPKPKPEPEESTKPEPKSRSKPKPRPKPKPKKKKRNPPKAKALKRVRKPKPKPKAKPKPKPEPEETEIEDKPLTRKNALDLRRETEQTEKDLLEQENQWDIPAFLRRKSEENQ
jgi:cell division protein FtsZ